MGDEGCAITMIVATLIIVGSILILFIRSQNEAQRKLRAADAAEVKKLNEAHDTYRRTLELLKTRPSDPDLRQRTLEWGRHYSNLARQRKGGTGVTIFDEVALSNDINAACAAASRAMSTAEPASIASSPPIEDRLSRLKSLFDSGAITPEEYRERRNRILDEV
jgi:hypothetical protein